MFIGGHAIWKLLVNVRDKSWLTFHQSKSTFFYFMNHFPTEHLIFASINWCATVQKLRRFWILISGNLNALYKNLNIWCDDPDDLRRVQPSLVNYSNHLNGYPLNIILSNALSLFKRLPKTITEKLRTTISKSATACTKQWERMIFFATKITFFSWIEVIVKDLKLIWNHEKNLNMKHMAVNLPNLTAANLCLKTSITLTFILFGKTYQKPYVLPLNIWFWINCN